MGCFFTDSRRPQNFITLIMMHLLIEWSGDVVFKARDKSRRTKQQGKAGAATALVQQHNLYEVSEPEHGPGRVCVYIYSRKLKIGLIHDVFERHGVAVYVSARVLQVVRRVRRIAPKVSGEISPFV